jgi:hypothetical protein
LFEILLIGDKVTPEKGQLLDGAFGTITLEDLGVIGKIAECHRGR